MAPHVRRRAFDVGLALLLLIASVADLATGALAGTYPGSAWAHLPFLVATSLPLLWRRTRPFLAFAVFAVVETAWITVMFPVDQQPPLVPYVQLLVMVYSVGAYTRGRGAWAAGAVFCVGLLADLPSVLAGKPLGDVAGPDFFLVVAFTFGIISSGLRRQAEEHERRALRAELEREEAAERAAAEERARIARELHDVISHDVSLMVLQASVERQVGRADDSAQKTLASIEATGREALSELRRMLGVLRKEGDPAPLAPPPGVAQVPDLVASAREAGVPVRLVVDGAPVPVPPGVDIAAYRVVQEGLTNAAKHASGADVTATIRYRQAGLDVEVLDAGGAVSLPSLASGGHGLTGLRERVSLLGGVFDAGPRPDGGFRLRVSLPLEAP
ncbi:MAG TPA: histidine kinase [Propionibacteriaceae bacterium]|nr:histidine kinase [Propionibacteriaceae bacterium]